MQIVWLIVIGFVGGVLGGMGMGGGTLLIPLLTIFLKVEQNIAQGINLLAFLPMSIVALIVHSKNKLVNIKQSFWIVITGILTALLGSYFANLVNPNNLRIYFAIFLILLGIFQFVSIFFNNPSYCKNNNNFFSISEMQKFELLKKQGETKCFGFLVTRNMKDRNKIFNKKFSTIYNYNNDKNTFRKTQIFCQTALVFNEKRKHYEKDTIIKSQKCN